MQSGMSIGVASDIRAVIRCPHCSLNQWEKALCRRCGKAVREELPAPVIVMPEPPLPRLPYSFGARLAKVRRFTGQSQYDLARGIGVNRPNISKAEHSTRGPFAWNISRYSNALGVPIEALVEEDEAVALAAIAVRHMSEADRDQMLGWLASRV